MKERDEVPDWALDHIRDKLPAGDEIINAVSFRDGLGGLTLVNTSRGAAVVTRRMAGPVHSALLTYPRDLVTFRCMRCDSRNVVVDIRPPSDVHCVQCGHLQHLVQRGEVVSSKTQKAESGKRGRFRMGLVRRRLKSAGGEP